MKWTKSEFFKRKEVNLTLHNQAPIRVIISGGGTGGHLYPALAIAEALQKIDPTLEILFVGALGKIEMEKVPAFGFKIIGLDIRGFNRSLSWENLKFPFRLIKSYFKARAILRDFKPDIAVGVGGYASGPLLFAAGVQGIPTLIQEQNSFPGKTNLYLAGKASMICVAYPHMERFFDPSKILITGNPIRQGLINSSVHKKEACKELGLEEGIPTLLVLGGSGGARTINEAMLSGLDLLYEKNIQIIWQTGKNYFDRVSQKVETYLKGKSQKNWKVKSFVDHMNEAYLASDLIISRAGAGTISEISILGKPTILVPSPNVAQDHQTKNATALAQNEAAVIVKDADADASLILKAIELMEDPFKRDLLSKNIRKMSYPFASKTVADSVIKIVTSNSKK